MTKILIADDDELMGDMYKTMLTLEKYDVTLIDQADEVIGKVIELKPSLILLDVMMPKINGIELLKQLKNNPETKSIPVVILTNLSVPEQINQALSLGAVKYLIKSEYMPQDISVIIKEILKI